MPDQSFNIIDWLVGGASSLALGIVGLFWYFWKDDRRRIKALEEYNAANKGISRTEVEVIVKAVQEKFEGDHEHIREDNRHLLETLEKHREESARTSEKHREETRQDFKEMRNLIMARYAGPDRRKNDDN